MRRRLPVLLLSLAGALALAGAAAAGNGGLAPVAPNSPNAERIRDSFFVVLAVTGAVFVLVEGALILFIVRFRGGGRARTVEGPQIHGATRLEVIWTLVPVVLLALIVSFVLYKLPGIHDTPPAAAGDRMNVEVEGHQYYWLFKYPDGRRSINVLEVPVGQVVTLDITAHDVVHSWWVPALGGKIDAIPGTVNRTWFRAERPGTFALRCAEFCGVQHHAMRGFVRVLPRGREPRPTQLGRQVFLGVCAGCHGFRGEGLIAPAIAGNATFNDPAALRELIRNGTGEMPAVGKTWDAQVMNAAVRYLRSRFGAQDGTSGG